MSAIDHLDPADLSTTGLTLAGVKQLVLGSTSLDESTKKQMAGALDALAKGLGRPIDTIPAAPVELRPLLAGLTPAMAGFNQGRWRNVLSLTTAALAHLGIVLVQGRIREEPSPAWKAILALLETGAGRHFHAWRFARYCTLVGIEPAAVNDDVLNKYEQDLLQRSLVAEPARCAREVARFWNEAAGKHPDWPQQLLAIPDNRRSYAPAWECFPASLNQDVAAWCESLGGGDPFDGREFAPLKPVSVDSRRRHMHCYLGALVATGSKPEELTSLAVVVTPARVQKALRFFWERAGKQMTLYVYKMADMALMVARHWAKLPAADIERLQAMAKQVRPTNYGMGGRNMTRLRQLEDPQRRKALLDLPAKLIGMAQKESSPGVSAALLVQTAVAVELLLNVPMRIRNLRELRIGTNLNRLPDGGMQLAVPAQDVKNKVAINASLPTQRAKPIVLYLDRYRSLLAEEGGDWLFPGAKPTRPKCDDAMRNQIRDALAKHCGLTLTPHVFRHFAAWMTLRKNPGAHGQVQRVLGHKSLNATMSFYSGLEAEAALEHYNDRITREREADPVDQLPKPGQGRRRTPGKGQK